VVSSSWRLLYRLLNGEQDREAKQQLRLIIVQGIGGCKNGPESRRRSGQCDIAAVAKMVNEQRLDFEPKSARSADSGVPVKKLVIK
jgi:hypothetical protein